MQSQVQQHERKGEISEVFSILAEYSSIKYENPLNFVSRFDRILLGFSFILFLIGFVLSLLIKVTSSMSVTLIVIVLCCFLLAIVSAVFVQLKSFFGSSKSLFQPTKSSLEGRAALAERDYFFTEKLKGQSELSLEFVRDRLKMEADHMRGRIGLLAGAIDKVGIIPLAAGWIFSGSKFLQDNHAPSIYVDITIGALGLFYVLCIEMVNTSYRFEELSHMVDSAIGRD